MTQNSKPSDTPRNSVIYTLIAQSNRRYASEYALDSFLQQQAWRTVFKLCLTMTDSVLNSDVCPLKQASSCIGENLDTQCDWEDLGCAFVEMHGNQIAKET